MNAIHRQSTIAHGEGDTFGGAGAAVSSDKNSGQGGLQSAGLARGEWPGSAYRRVGSGEEEAESVFANSIPDEVRARGGPNENKHTRAILDDPFTGGVILQMYLFEALDALDGAEFMMKPQVDAWICLHSLGEIGRHALAKVPAAHDELHAVSET